MKFALLALLTLTQTAGAFELLKCNGQKHGTLWGSFGKLWESDKQDPTYFPTEFVFFGKDFQARNLYPSFKEAVQTAPIIVRKNSVRMEFTFSQDGRVQQHVLQLLMWNPEIPNAFLGNWTVTEEEGNESYDYVACSLD
jgi:hypothetical protein